MIKKTGKFVEYKIFIKSHYFFLLIYDDKGKK